MATPIGKSRGACSTAHGILPTKGKAPVDLQSASTVFSSTKARKVAGLPCLAELLYATRDPSNTAILVQSNGKT